MNQKTAKHLRKILRKFKNIDPRERSYKDIVHKRSISFIDSAGEEKDYPYERVQKVLSPECGRGLYKLAKHAIA